MSAKTDLDAFRQENRPNVDVLRQAVMDGENLTKHANRSFRFAAYRGDLDSIRYLIEESGQPIDPTDVQNSAIRDAAENGHFEVVKYIVEETAEYINLSMESFATLRGAAKNNHLEIVRYLIEDTGQRVDLHVLNNALINDSVCSGATEVLHYLFHLEPKLYKGREIEIIDLAAEFEQLSTLKCCIGIFGASREIEKNNDQLLQSAFRMYQDEVIEYFLEEMCPPLTLNEQVYSKTLQKYDQDSRYKILSHSTEFITALSESPLFTVNAQRSIVRGKLQKIFETDLQYTLSINDIEELVGYRKTGERIINDDDSFRHRRL